MIVLDGLERVLVAYHRHDAAQLRDEQAGDRDTIAHRDPSAAIRPDDDELLRELAATKSKILITSRLIPRVLLNPSSQPIPGVRHERLPGLRPADAEALLRHSGVRGDSQQIQDYLQRNCDCHPLVTGVLAGLVNHYLRDRGNFDAWAADPTHRGKLNLANLDLVQKRNHILQTALDALPDLTRQLLSTLALLSEAVDYFSEQPHDPYERAETLDDLRNGLHLIRTLLQMGRTRQAAAAYIGDLANALMFNLNAAAETLSLVRPFFTADWANPSADLGDEDVAYLANQAGVALEALGQIDQALVLTELWCVPI